MSFPTSRQTTPPLSILLDRHFLTCSAALTGAVFSLPAPTASGAIVFSGTQDIPIFPSPPSGGVYFDLEAPFTVAQDDRPAGWDFNPYKSGQSLYVNSNTSVVLSGSIAGNLTAGAVIDGSSQFSAVQFYGGVEIPVGSTGYVGFKFDPDNIPGVQTFYGWVQISVGDNASTNGNVINWAYDDTGAPITVGAVPEPTSLALLAFGAAGVATWRRRTQAIAA